MGRFFIRVVTTAPPFTGRVATHLYSTDPGPRTLSRATKQEPRCYYKGYKRAPGPVVMLAGHKGRAVCSNPVKPTTVVVPGPHRGMLAGHKGRTGPFGVCRDQGTNVPDRSDRCAMIQQYRAGAPALG